MIRRGCTSCLTRRVHQQQQPQRSSLSTLAKPPHSISLSRTGPGGGAVRSRHTGRSTINITATTRRQPSAKLPYSVATRKTPGSKISAVAAGLRRKATLASGEASKQQQQQQRNLWEDLQEVLSAILGKPRTIPIPRWVSPKHHSITLSEVCGHASFILVAASYAVDDFLWLRIIAVAGSTSMLFFTYFHPHGRVLWLPFKWNCLFIAINSYRIGKIYYRRYLAEQLSPELMETRSKHFYLMDPVDFAKLANIGRVESFQKGDVIISQDEPNSVVRVVLSGGLKVLRNGKLTYTLSEGNFVSESGLHAGLMLPDSVDSCCTTVAESDVRLLTWDRTELCDLLHRNPPLRRFLMAVVSWDIVRKLKAQRIMISHGIITDPADWTVRRNEQTEHRYASLLKNLLSHDRAIMEERKKELNKYRTIHHIDDEHHMEALKACGWTLEEFEAGHQDGVTPEQLAKQRPHHGPEWYFRQAIERILG